MLSENLRKIITENPFFFAGIRLALGMMCILGIILCIQFIKSTSDKEKSHVFAKVVINTVLLVLLFIVAYSYVWTFNIPVTQIIGFDPVAGFKKGFDAVGMALSSGTLTNILLLCLIIKMSKH